jgi:hypothetical protein
VEDLENPRGKRLDERMNSNYIDGAIIRTEWRNFAMSLSIFVTITGPFIKFIGEGLADLKCQRLADIDLEQLRLQRKILAEKLELLPH